MRSKVDKDLAEKILFSLPGDVKPETALASMACVAGSIIGSAPCSSGDKSDLLEEFIALLSAVATHRKSKA